MFLTAFAMPLSLRWSSEIFVVERFELVKRNSVILSAVVEIGVGSAFDHKKLFIVGVLVSVYHILIRIFSEVERMCLVTVKHHDSRAYLVAVVQDRHIDERHTADLVPAAVGIERTRVITSFSLVVRMVIFYEIRCVFGQRIDNTAAKLILAGLVIPDTLGIQCLLHGIPLFLAVYG